MLRKIGLAVVALFALGCGGGGGDAAPIAWKSLNGELTDGDVNVINNLRADPYDFIGVRTGTATIKLHAHQFHGLIRVYDTQGNLIGQSVGNTEFEGHVDFPVLLDVKYKVLVTAATSDDSGTYTIEYSPEIEYWSQIK